MPSRDIDRELVDAADAGNDAQVSALLALGANPMRESSKALLWAAYKGHEECVRLLLPVSDPKEEMSRALRWAATNGHAECARLLLPVSDPQADDSHALRWAAKNGHAECVKLLMPASEPKARESQALKLAARNGHGECVKLLLPVSDALAGEFEALRGAAYNGHEQCVRLLLAASGPLGEIDGLLEQVIETGCAKVAAVLIGAEPRLLDGINLPKCLAEALAKEHRALAAYLSAIMEQRELSGMGQNRPDSRPVAGRL